MQRQLIQLEQIAAYDNLLLALHKAAKGKRNRDNVIAFLQACDDKLMQLSSDILAEKLPYGRFKTFQIYDPKKRLIHAACFEDRVFHHAVMNLAGEHLEKGMFFHSYACRPDKGVHRAARQVQYNLRRFAWYVKIDIAAYFSHIRHDYLFALLQRRFKGNAFLAQLERVIYSCSDMQGIGLPIGSLTSQCFANFYLDGLDRFLANNPAVRANVRYMDDVIWWCDSKTAAKRVLAEAQNYLWEQRALVIKPNRQILPSEHGVTYCGFRILQGSMGLTRRRKKAIKQCRAHWEECYLQGDIDELQLQAIGAVLQGMAQGTDSLAWRRQQLGKFPEIDA